MSQFGMQMPGTRAKRGSSPDVYTGLAVLAMAFLIGACVVMWSAASKVGKNGTPWEFQDPKKIELKVAK